MGRLQSIGILVLLSLFATAPSFSQSKSAAKPTNITSPYHGFKLPPKEVPTAMPYTYKRSNILGVEMAYVDEGQGDPVLFLHGVPTSSYLWRNIMPHMEDKARVIALDLVGFGESDKIDKVLKFSDHYQYLDAFISSKKLKNITLVLHDWGSALGLHYARLNPDKIKAIVTMESIIAPTMPAERYEHLRGGVERFFRLVRSPEGRRSVVEENAFVERFLPSAIDRPLHPEALDKYREAFIEPSSRKQSEVWPLQMPIAGEPADMVDIVSAYNDWLMKTEKPWLLLYASPGGLNPTNVADYWAKHGKNVQTTYIGNGLHFVQEDQPYAIGRAISDWYRRLPE